MARWNACLEVVLCVIELLFLSLTVEALEGKMCQNSLTSGGGGSFGAKISGRNGLPPAKILIPLERQLIAYNFAANSFWATVCKTVRPMLSVRCLSCPVLSVCDVRALCPNGWTDQKETWHGGRPRLWPHCVKWGPSSPSPKGAQSPNFRPISLAAKWLHG